MNLVGPEGIFSEDGWSTDPEEVLENEAPDEEFVDIGDILGPVIPKNDRNTEKQVKNKPRKVTRSGRVVKVVNKDNF